MTTYGEELKAMATNKIAKEVIEKNYGKSIERIQELILTEEYSHISDYYFQGDLAILYPKVIEAHAAKNYTCDFSGALITKGSLYINYNCLIHNLSNGSKYVLKYPLRVETGYSYDLPYSLSELEELNYRILNDDYYEGIDCSNLNRKYGEILLRKLKR